MLYEKRFGLLQKDTEEEALTFIAAIKTVSRPPGQHVLKARMQNS